MQRFIKIFLIHRTTYSLLLCLLLSTILIFSNQNEQVLTLRAMFVDLAGTVTQKLNWFSRVFTALEENKRLVAENQQLSFLNDQYREIREQNTRLHRLLDFKERSPYEFRTGNIIQWNAPLFSVVTIDLGQEDGVVKNDPVITDKGLVGKIIKAGQHTSICQLFTDANFRVSVQVKNSNAPGFLAYDNNNYAVMNIPSSASLAVGDSVFTSSHGDIYPNGIPVGRVVSFTTDPGLFKTVTVELFVNYALLKEVSVIIRNDTEENAR